jgi:hypothetical protein
LKLLGLPERRAALLERVSLDQVRAAATSARHLKEICPMRLVSATAVLLLLGGFAAAQTDFEVTGTPIPTNLLRQNYGSIPKGISAFDLNICNVADTKQSLVSSRIYQALAGTTASLEPIGRDIMLAAIIRNQSHALTSIVGIALNSTTSVLSVLSASRYRMPGGLITGVALGSITGQQVINNLKPILSADQLEKFESQVLEPALVLDSGSCVERTVFVSTAATPKTKARMNGTLDSLSFHIH